MSTSMRWTLFNCEKASDYACRLFRDVEHDLSSLSLSYPRYCDTVWDTRNGEDEKNCSQWICAQGNEQCQRTGQCFSLTSRCDGEFDCDNGEDELNCPTQTRQWKKEKECNSTSEMFCFTPEYLSDPLSHRSCLSATKIGDGHIDCLGGRDERNVFACPDRQMLGERFLCDQQTQCLHYSSICNGIDDCHDRTDELICSWNRTKCALGTFACADGRGCPENRCDSREDCVDRSNWFWCPNPRHLLSLNYRSTKDRSLFFINEKFCLTRSNTSPRLLSLVEQSSSLVSPSVLSGFCNRGFYLHGLDRSNVHCFCPPSFYGDRCQYDRRRVTLILAFDRWEREKIPLMINVLVTLLQNKTTIVDHHFLTDFTRSSFDKHHLYLLYPRPHLPGSYSVRVEAYHSLQFLAVWEYSISPLDFLPVFRFSKVLRFSEDVPPSQCRENRCQNNGRCYQTTADQPICLCAPEWYGPFCERQAIPPRCAPNSLVRGDQICICPQGYLLPNCFIPNRRCEPPNSCPIHERCYPISQQPPNLFRCFSNRVEQSRYRHSSSLTIRRNRSSSLSFLFQLLTMSEYPTVRQQILVHPWMNFPIQQPIHTFNILFRKESLAELGLVFIFEPLKRSVDRTLHSVGVYYSESLTNVTIDLDVQLNQCRFLKETHISSINTFTTMGSTGGPHYTLTRKFIEKRFLLLFFLGRR